MQIEPNETHDLIMATLTMKINRADENDVGAEITLSSTMYQLHKNCEEDLEKHHETVFTVVATVLAASIADRAAKGIETKQQAVADLNIKLMNCIEYYEKTGVDTNMG